jgi:hypothetical protein
VKEGDVAMRVPLLVSLTGLTWSCLSASPAHAIPIIWDRGETVIRLADLPPQSPLRKQPNVPAQLQPDKIGYKYWRLRIFWCPIWTTDGTFVAYSRERDPYLPLSTNPEEAAKIAGMDPKDVSVPILYRFPMGWWIIAGLIILGSIAAAFDKPQPPAANGAQPMPLSSEEAKLLTDEKYQQAISAVYGEGRIADQVTMDDISRGIDSLVAQGVPREEAELNLALVLEKLRTMTRIQPPS